MKWICCLIMILSCQIALSQSSKKEMEAYHVQIKHLNGTKSKGMLHSMDHSTVRIVSIKRRDSVFQDIPTVEIDRVLIRNKKISGASVLIGVLVGGLVGYSTYEEPSDDYYEYVPESSAPSIIVGAFIGGVVGVGVSICLVKKWEIKGSKERYDQLRPKLIKYCITCN